MHRLLSKGVSGRGMQAPVPQPFPPAGGSPQARTLWFQVGVGMFFVPVCPDVHAPPGDVSGPIQTPLAPAPVAEISVGIFSQVAVLGTVMLLKGADPHSSAPAFPPQQLPALQVPSVMKTMEASQVTPLLPSQLQVGQEALPGLSPLLAFCFTVV